MNEADVPRLENRRARDDIMETENLLAAKTGEFDDEESNMRNEVIATHEELNNNINVIEDITRVLKERRPIYANVKAEANRNDTICSRVKKTLSQRRAHSASLNKQIEELIADTEKL